VHGCDGFTGTDAVTLYGHRLWFRSKRLTKWVVILFDQSEQAAKITDEEMEGIKLFIDPERTKCLQCHNGPMLSNGGFHNIGSGNFQGEQLDFGRMFGLQAVLVNEFNCLGDYSDADSEDCAQLRFLNKTQHHIPLQGAFKVPTLRGLRNTFPYFHDGRFSELSEVLEYYKKPPENNGEHELKKLELTDAELQSIDAFLDMLNEL